MLKPCYDSTYTQDLLDIDFPGETKMSTIKEAKKWIAPTIQVVKMNAAQAAATHSAADLTINGTPLLFS